MLKAALFAALYGVSNAYRAATDMCCTANIPMSNTYSVCEDVMNKYSYPADQEYACLSGKSTGKHDGVNVCKWTECSNVGYCVEEISVWNAEQSWGADGSWGVARPTPTPRPTNPPKTSRPTLPPKTPKPTVMRCAMVCMRL